MTVTYLVVIVVGSWLTAVSLGLVTMFGDDRDAQFSKIVSPFLIPVAYAVRELARLRPRRVKA